MTLSTLGFIPTINLATLKLYTKFEDSGSHTRREVCDRKFDWRERKNGQIEGMTHTHIVTEKTKTIYTLYTSYTGV